MNRKSNIFALLLTALLAVSCTESDMPAPKRPATQRVEVPVFIHTATGADGTRGVTGDPGVDADILPKHFYVFACLQTGESSWELHYVQRGENVVYDPNSNDAPESNAGDVKWTYDEENEWWQIADRGQASFNFTSTTWQSGRPEGTVVGHTYAIITEKALTWQQINQIYTLYASEGTPATGVTPYTEGKPNLLKKENITTDPNTAIQQALLTFGADWTSKDFRHLYSTPHRHTTVDHNSIRYGDIQWREKPKDDDGTAAGGKGLVSGEVHLYHVAARVDFTWEVPAANQATQSVTSITVTGLPTQCCIFDPTHNPAPTGEGGTAIINTTPGNKWIGRECVYVLQPNVDAPTEGKIQYTVDKLTGTDPALTFTPTQALDPLFTGWYRIIANVEP